MMQLLCEEASDPIDATLCDDDDVGLCGRLRLNIAGILV